MLNLSSFLSLNQQDHQLSATSARSLIICQRTAFKTKLILLLLELSLLIYMKSSFRRIKRMRKCLLLKIMRQKTRDFHQKHDERCVNFFNDKHVR